MVFFEAHAFQDEIFKLGLLVVLSKATGIMAKLEVCWRMREYMNISSAKYESEKDLI